MARDWVPDPMRIPGNPEREICLHTVQLAQRKHMYEDPIGRTRSEAGMRIYRFSQSVHTATGPILLYRPHARDGEGPLEMVHWPPRLYRKVPPPVMMVVDFFFLIAGCNGSLGYWQSLATRESNKQHQWYCVPKESQVPIHYDLSHHNLCMTERMVHKREKRHHNTKQKPKTKTNTHNQTQNNRRHRGET